MTDYSEHPRVLVVDDAADMRTAIRRVLTANGYRVDEAGTLAEARALTPSGYDVVLVDMQLGPERGVSLIEELTGADPGFARRCLAMSGNPGSIPSAVAALAKPFMPDQLIEAMRALDGSQPQPRAARRAGAEKIGSGPATRREPGAGIGLAQTLLDMSALLRERERAAFADALHDEPVQDLAVAVMELHLIRQQLPAGQQELLASLAMQIDKAAMSLHELMRQYSPSWLEETPAEIIGKRTTWLLAAPPAVRIHSSCEGMSQETARFVASVAELVLCTAAGSPASADHRPHARIGVSDATHTLDIEITAGRAPGDPGPGPGDAAPDAARRRSMLSELGSALGVGINLTFYPDELRVRVSL